MLAVSLFITRACSKPKLNHVNHISYTYWKQWNMTSWVMKIDNAEMFISDFTLLREKSMIYSKIMKNSNENWESKYYI